MNKLLIFMLIFFSGFVSAKEFNYLYWHDRDLNVYKKDGTFVGKVDTRIVYGYMEVFDPEVRKSLNEAKRFYIQPDGNTFFMHNGKEVLLKKIKISFYI